MLTLLFDVLIDTTLRIALTEPDAAFVLPEGAPVYISSYSGRGAVVNATLPGKMKGPVTRISSQSAVLNGASWKP